MTFKVGDKVLVVSKYDLKVRGCVGVVVDPPVSYDAGDCLLVQFENREGLHNGYGCGDTRKGPKDKWYVHPGNLVLVEKARVQPKPTLATTLKLYPQDRKVLAHLEGGKPITPMKALVVYGISRLAACVHNIRKAGYDVAKEILIDEAGHKYASYQLAKKEVTH